MASELELLLYQTNWLSSTHKSKQSRMPCCSQCHLWVSY